MLGVRIALTALHTPRLTASHRVTNVTTATPRYEGEIHPGETLVWPVQMFHSTTGDDFSFAFQQHFNIPLLAKVYEARNGGKTFLYEPGPGFEAWGAEPQQPAASAIELPITM